MFSTVPAVRAALVDLFTTALDQPTDPKVSYGHPGRHVPERYVAVGSAVDPVTRDIMRMPHGPTASLDENYGIVVQVRVLSRGGEPTDQRRVFEDSFALMARLDAALRADYRLALGGEPLVTHCHLGTVDLAEGPLNEGWESVVTATAVVKAARI